MLAHPRLQGLRVWRLATRDAHGLYEKVGFRRAANPRGPDGDHRRTHEGDGGHEGRRIVGLPADAPDAIRVAIGVHACRKTSAREVTAERLHRAVRRRRIAWS